MRRHSPFLHLYVICPKVLEFLFIFFFSETNAEFYGPWLILKSSITKNASPMLYLQQIHLLQSMKLNNKTTENQVRILICQHFKGIVQSWSILFIEMKVQLFRQWVIWFLKMKNSKEWLQVLLKSCTTRGIAVIFFHSIFSTQCCKAIIPEFSFRVYNMQ